MDDLIEKNEKIFSTLFKEATLIYKSLQCDQKKASDIISSIISIDYGKEVYFEGSTKCYIFRGTDINEVKNGKTGNPPLRYIKNSKIKNNIVMPYDI